MHLSDFVFFDDTSTDMVSVNPNAEALTLQVTGESIPTLTVQGMVAGLYYSQGGVVYLCTRNTGNPVHNALSELVGLFVEVA